MNHKYIPVRTLASGHEYGLDVYTFEPEKSWGTVYFQAALHGAEVQGIGVIHQLMQFLKKEQFPYTVKVVACANPQALDTKMGEYTYGRFDPKTGVNWNRGFKNLLEASPFFEVFDLEGFVQAHRKEDFSSVCQTFEAKLRERLMVLLDHPLAPEEKLALTLHAEALEADYCFDLHCDSVSVPYIYLPSYLVTKRLKHFKSCYFIETPCEFSPCFNQALFFPFWKLTHCWNMQTGQDQVPPKHSFTYELGSKESLDMEAAKELMTGIVRYVLNKEDANKKDYYVCQEKDYVRLRALKGGLVDYQDALLGRAVCSGQPLAQLFSKEDLVSGKEGQSIVCDQESVLLTRTSSSVLHEGDEVVKVMTHYKLLS